MRACFDCHSNETKWPWYSNVAPVSWVLQRHVDERRDALNFSEWGREQEADDVAETIQEGEMPPHSYLALHPEARLSAAEQQALIRGLELTLGRWSGASGSERSDRRDRDERRERR